MINVSEKKAGLKGVLLDLYYDVFLNSYWEKKVMTHSWLFINYAWLCMILGFKIIKMYDLYKTDNV